MSRTIRRVPTNQSEQDAIDFGMVKPLQETINDKAIDFSSTKDIQHLSEIELAAKAKSNSNPANDYASKMAADLVGESVVSHSFTSHSIPLGGAITEIAERIFGPGLAALDAYGLAQEDKNNNKIPANSNVVTSGDKMGALILNANAIPTGSCAIFEEGSSFAAKSLAKLNLEQARKKALSKAFA